MSNLDTINVGGIDYDIEDSDARSKATSAVNITAYIENGDEASRAYSVVGTPINWKGNLYYTSATIAEGATLAIGTNLTTVANIGLMLSNIKVYVDQEEQLHFVDATGADSVLPFSGKEYTRFHFRPIGNLRDGANYVVCMVAIPKDATQNTTSMSAASGTVTADNISLRNSGYGSGYQTFYVKPDRACECYVDGTLKASWTAAEAGTEKSFSLVHSTHSFIIYD